MVFCGKPSKGCSHCRVRRIKCDQIDPACSQCLRAGKTCPGYRDQLSLLFRDESEKVVRKAKVPKADHRKSSHWHAKSMSGSDQSPSASPPTLSPQVGHSHALVVASPSLPICSLSPEKLDEGILFFFEHYVTIISNFPEKIDSPRSRASPNWPLLFTNNSFKNAVSSVGYAGLSNVTNSPNYMVLARKNYAKSLANITIALKDTAKADLDATFKSVMLLAAFEVVNGGGAGAGSWGVHLDGGTAILKLIAAKQPQKVPPQRMQLQFVFSVFIKCLTSGEPSPPGMKEWTEQLTKTMTPDDAHATTLAYIVSRYADLNATLRSNLLTDSAAVVRKILVLDSEIEQWELQLSPAWRYNLVPFSEENDKVYGGQSHRYRDFWTARMYTHYRWARILLQEKLLVHMAQLGSFASEEDIAQRSKSLAIILRLATDLCSSVGGQFHRPTLLDEARRQGVPALSGCFLLLFPLAVAGSAMGVPDELHDWVIHMLETIGHKMGVAQALSMIHPTKMQREKWKLISGTPSNNWRLQGFKM